MTGHSVLQLPVPALEDWVRERTRHYDPDFVSADPAFGHAHITALGPFDPDPSLGTLEAIDAIAAASAPITVALTSVAQFPDGTIHLRPDSDARLRALTKSLVAAFPEHPPYGGRFGADVDPHLTLDATYAEPGPDGPVTVETTRALLGDLIPVTVTLTELQLAWWEAGGCRVLHRWRLGPSPDPAV